MKMDNTHSFKSVLLAKIKRALNFLFTDQTETMNLNKPNKTPLPDDYLMTYSNLLTTDCPNDHSEIKTHRKRNSCASDTDRNNGFNSKKTVQRKSNRFMSSGKKKPCKLITQKHDLKLRSTEKEIPGKRQLNNLFSAVSKTNYHKKGKSTVSIDRYRTCANSNSHLEMRVNTASSLVHQNFGSAKNLELILQRCKTVLNQYSKRNLKLQKDNQKLKKENKEYKSYFK